MSLILSRVRDTLDRMVTLLNADDYPALAAFYDFPFMMEMEDRAVVFITPDDAMKAWAAFRALMIQQDNVRSDIHIVGVELPRMSRQRVWVEFRHFDATGRITRSSDITMFFRLRRDRMLLEMQHVTRQGMPESWALAGARHG